MDVGRWGYVEVRCSGTTSGLDWGGALIARKLDELEKEVAQLPRDQLREFRAWYEQFDATAWDEELERDVASGKLDGLADSAIADHKAGKFREL